MRRLRSGFLYALSILMVIVATTQALAAEPIFIRLWNTDTYRNEGLRPIVDEFNKTHADIQIELEAKSGAANSLIPAVAGGAGPNIIVGASSWDRDYYDQGILADLMPYIKRDKFDLGQYFSSTLEFGQMPSGEIFALPLDSQIIAIYYNPDVLAASGLNPPTPAWNNADLRDMTTKLRRTEADGTITQHAMVGKHPNHVGMYFMAQNRSYLVDLTHGIDSTVTTPGFRSAYAFIEELIVEDRLRIEGVHPGINTSLFTTGKCGLYVDGNFRLFDLTQAMQSLEVAPLLMPDEGGKPGAYLWTRTLALVKSGDPKVDEAAWKVIRHLSSRDALTRYTVEARLLPVASTSISHPLFRKYVQEFGAPLDVMAGVYLPAGSGRTEMGAPRAGDIRAPWQSLQTPFMRSEMSLGSFIETLAAKVEMIVDEVKAKQ